MVHVKHVLPHHPQPVRREGTPRSVWDELQGMQDVLSCERGRIKVTGIWPLRFSIDWVIWVFSKINKVDGA